MLYCACDPGKKGAIVLLDENEITNQWIIPLTKEGEVDGIALCELTFELREKFGVERVCIEDPHAIYGTSTATMWSMASTIGRILQAFDCQGIKVVQVRPKAWQKVIWTAKDMVEKPSKTGKNMVTDTKATAYNSAIRLFPNHDNWIHGDNESKGRKTKIHDGIVDAALIAYYFKTINQK